jgi:hypothetical protein
MAYQAYASPYAALARPPLARSVSLVRAPHGALSSSSSSSPRVPFSLGNESAAAAYRYANDIMAGGGVASLPSFPIPTSHALLRARSRYDEPIHVPTAISVAPHDSNSIILPTDPLPIAAPATSLTSNSSSGSSAPPSTLSLSQLSRSFSTGASEPPSPMLMGYAAYSQPRLLDELIEPLVPSSASQPIPPPVPSLSIPSVSGYGSYGADPNALLPLDICHAAVVPPTPVAASAASAVSASSVTLAPSRSTPNVSAVSPLGPFDWRVISATRTQRMNQWAAQSEMTAPPSYARYLRIIRRMALGYSHEPYRPKPVEEELSKTPSASLPPPSSLTVSLSTEPGHAPSATTSSPQVTGAMSISSFGYGRYGSPYDTPTTVATRELMGGAPGGSSSGDVAAMLDKSKKIFEVISKEEKKSGESSSASAAAISEPNEKPRDWNGKHLSSILTPQISPIFCLCLFQQK